MTQEIKSYKQMRKEFYEQFTKKIVPFVEKFDNKRKIKLVFAIIASSFFSVLAILALLPLVVYIPDSDTVEACLKGSLLCFGLAGGSWYFIKKGFENSIKEHIMPAVCNCLGDFTWSEGDFADISEGLISASYVVPYFSSSEYDDHFYGEYKDVKISIHEARYLRRGNKSDYTVFRGVVVILDMNKNFQTHTVIKPDSIFRSAPISTLVHTKLEDVIFESKFDVFTDDEVEARYLITTSFMSRLNNIKTAFSAKKVSCAFYGEKLLIGLDTGKDIFSICSLIKPLSDPQQYFQMYEEIVSIIKLIDYFKLDQKIGL